MTLCVFHKLKVNSIGVIKRNIGLEDGEGEGGRGGERERHGHA